MGSTLLGPIRFEAGNPSDTHKIRLAQNKRLRYVIIGTYLSGSPNSAVKINLFNDVATAFYPQALGFGTKYTRQSGGYSEPAVWELDFLLPEWGEWILNISVFHATGSTVTYEAWVLLEDDHNG